jgi:lysophospholipase L1-like esterase
MKRNRIMHIERVGVGQLFCLIVSLFMAKNLCAQSSVEFSYKSFGLESAEFNTIQNASHLDDFFEKLYQLKLYAKDRVNIIQIGDSHIQADYMTEVVRKNFQKDFGNAGRGLIVPCRVAGTNEPPNFQTSSSVPWIAKRIVHPQQPMPIGIGGITINTMQEATLNIKMNDPLHDYSFNKVMLFFQKDSRSYNFSLRDTTGEELGFIGPYTDEPFMNYSNITFIKRTNQISIQTLKATESQNQATIFGVELENGNPGILYHAIGVNGAKYAHYNQALYFARQTQALLPELFIISLGTNESIDYPYIDKSFFQQIDKLIESLKKYNPQAKFILVTPPDAFKKKIKSNPGIQIIREQIIQYAVENGLAFWDMYKALGGTGAANTWRKEGLLRPDGVHFTKEGYQYQGDLFYSAIMKCYNQYVLARSR